MKKTSVIGVALLALAGCAGPTAESIATVPLERSAPAVETTPTPAASGPVALGSKQETRDENTVATVTPLRLRTLKATGGAGLERKGYEYLAVDVKLCVTENTSSEEITVSGAPWSLAFPDDTTAAPSAFSSGWFDVPLYPQDREVREGTCVRGWIPFEIPKGSKPSRLLYQPGSGNSLEWAVT